MSIRCVYTTVTVYDSSVPKLWTETIESHRREVADAILEAAAAVHAKLGLREVTMSRVAEHAGIGRATLYKYFPDVEAIFAALHARHVDSHLAAFVAIAKGHGPPLDRLEAMLTEYAVLRQGHRGTVIEALLQGSPIIARAHESLHDALRGVIAEAQTRGSVRNDVPASELSTFCLHALGAAGALSSKPAARRVVALIVRALSLESPTAPGRTNP
jgi:AcrR family transcriptional regulator